MIYEGLPTTIVRGYSNLFFKSIELGMRGID
jgi:hypothetical protein